MRLLFKVMLIFFSLLYSNHQVLGQDNFNVTIGWGTPEALNIGMRLQYGQTQIGFSYGWPVHPDVNGRSISGDIYYHFGGYSRFTEVRPWYVRIGLNYSRDEDEIFIYKTTSLNSRIGKDFNFSSKFGMQIDVGLSIELKYEEIEKRPAANWDIIESTVWPSVGIRFFYRI